MYFYRDHKRVAYYDCDQKTPNDGQFSAITNSDAPRIVKTGFFEEHNITIINVTNRDSGFYRCIATYSIKKDTFRFRSNISCNVYRVEITDRDKGTDSEESTHSFPVPDRESCPAAVPVLVIVITATISVLITMILTLCFIPKVKQWSRSRGSSDVPAHSHDHTYEIMTRNGFRPVTGPTA